MNYKEKYFKYKEKFLNLKNQLGGTTINIHSQGDVICSLCYEHFDNALKKPVALHNRVNAANSDTSTEHYICLECYNKPITGIFNHRTKCLDCMQNINQGEARICDFDIGTQRIAIPFVAIPIVVAPIVAAPIVAAPIVVAPIGILTRVILEQIFPNLQNLNTIELNNCGINGIIPGAFNNLPELRFLRLNDNNIVNIVANTFNNLQNLNTIELNNCGINGITPGAFNNLPELRFLRLNYNNIVNIVANTFNNLQNLNTIELNNCGINGITPGAFNNLPELRFLRLRNNVIQYATVLPNILINVPHINLQYCF